MLRETVLIMSSVHITGAL